MTTTVLPETAQAQSRPTLGSIYVAGIHLSAIDGEIGRLAELLENDDPEIAATAIKDLEALLAAQEEGREVLVERCDRALAIADLLLGQAASRRAMAKRLTAIAQADEARVERLQDLAINMAILAHPAQKRISLPMHDLVSRKSTAVVCDEEIVAPEDLPDELVRVKREFDKTAIKAFLTKGGKREGLSLEQRLNWKVEGA